jgi:23S rRNA (guanosine2251-2'-O)-methyltransferase
MAAEELISGIHAVEMLLRTAPDRIKRLSIQQGRHDNRILKLLEIAHEKAIKVEEASTSTLNALLPNVKHQGIIAHCCQAALYKESDIESLLTNLQSPPFLLILDGIQDPHNLGACLRTANAAGVDFVIASTDRSVGLTPVVHKVASGAAEVTPFIQVTNLARTLRLLKSLGIWLYGATGEASASLYETELQGAIAWVMGAEGTGLRRLTRDLCDYLVSIPMQGVVESLNVSVATGVCLYETVRQQKYSNSHIS